MTNFKISNHPNWQFKLGDFFVRQTPIPTNFLLESPTRDPQDSTSNTPCKDQAEPTCTDNQSVISQEDMHSMNSPLKTKSNETINDLDTTFYEQPFSQASVTCQSELIHDQFHTQPFHIESIDSSQHDLSEREGFTCSLSGIEDGVMFQVKEEVLQVKGEVLQVKEELQVKEVSQEKQQIFTQPIESDNDQSPLSNREPLELNTQDSASTTHLSVNELNSSLIQSQESNVHTSPNLLDSPRTIQSQSQSMNSESFNESPVLIDTLTSQSKDTSCDTILVSLDNNTNGYPTQPSRLPSVFHSSLSSPYKSYTSQQSYNEQSSNEPSFHFESELSNAFESPILFTRHEFIQPEPSICDSILFNRYESVVHELVKSQTSSQSIEIGEDLIVPMNSTKEKEINTGKRKRVDDVFVYIPAVKRKKNDMCFKSRVVLSSGRVIQIDLEKWV